MSAPRARRVRIDQLLVDRGLAPSRAKAQAMILAGDVFVGEARAGKAGDTHLESVALRVAARSRFVSRGGDKLEGALAALGGFDHLQGRTCLDVGASTGGFTDCLLQRGATRVHAVDVGWGQLHASLRTDPRVVVRERTNARELVEADFDAPIDLVVVDASFIGLEKLLTAILRVMRSGGDLVALVKPQFEVGREEASRTRGVIKDDAIREAAIATVRIAIAEHGLTILGEVDSEVHGPKGNVERFVHARKG